jgi:hypothetical protein
MLVLMKHSTESVASSYVKAGDLLRNHQRYGRWVERAGVTVFAALTRVRYGSHLQGLRAAEGDIRMEAEPLAWR